PMLVKTAQRSMNDRNVAANPNLKTRQMRRKRKIHVVTVKAVKGLLVKFYLVNHFAPRRDEQSVHCLDVWNFAQRNAKHFHREHELLARPRMNNLPKDV